MAKHVYFVSYVVALPTGARSPHQVNMIGNLEIFSDAPIESMVQIVELEKTIKGKIQDPTSIVRIVNFQLLRVKN